MDFLKLVAFDDDDLKLIAAHAQDAVIKIGDLAFQPQQKQFVIPMNRFAWEREKKPRFFHRSRHQRHQSVLHFSRVFSVRSIGVDKRKPAEIISLLTIHFVRTEPPAGRIELVFSGNAALSLDVECIEARLADTGAAWETSGLPRHD